MPFELASALPKQVEEIGAIAGIVSFVLMLALYIVRAMELRKLRRTMPFLVDPQNGKPDNGRSGPGRP